MQMVAHAVRLQCTSWTSMTAKSTHAHYVRMRIMKCTAQPFAIKIVQIIKYKKSCRFKKWLLICGAKAREGCSQCQVLPLILLITSPLTYGLPGTSHGDITNQKAVVHYKRARKYVSNGLLIGDVELRS